MRVTIAPPLPYQASDARPARRSAFNEAREQTQTGACGAALGRWSLNCLAKAAQHPSRRSRRGAKPSWPHQELRNHWRPRRSQLQARHHRRRVYSWTSAKRRRCWVFPNPRSIRCEAEALVRSSSSQQTARSVTIGKTWTRGLMNAGDSQRLAHSARKRAMPESGEEIALRLESVADMD